MIDIDDPRTYQRLDPSNMRGRLRELPRSCRAGWRKRPSPPLPPHYRNVERILVLGVGGSAIAGDLLRDLMARGGGPPIEVLRGFSLGPGVDEKSLVIGSSYSGNTEETLSSFAEAGSRGGRRIVLASGGRLKAMAQEKGLPLYVIDLQSEPRMALGMTFFTLLRCLTDLGLAAEGSEEVEEAIQTIEGMSRELSEEMPVARNPAKSLATRLYGRLIVVYGSDIFSSISRRWKTQFNENGKAWAFYEELPEATHNGIEGFANPRSIAGQVHALLLWLPSLSPALQARYLGVEELLERAGIEHDRLEAGGQGPLSQMMSLILLGDYASYYLGILYGLDPSPVPNIEYLKRRLRAPDAAPESPSRVV